MKNLKLLSLILAFVGTVLGQAQTAPPAINYQGRLTQATGVVVPDGLTGMRVRIFASASGGAALWDSGDLLVATKSGTFSILLGSGGMPAMSPSVFALGSVYIEVQPTGQAPLLPRQSIATVPWAFYAQTVSDGSITTSKLADLQVTLSKMALNSVSGAQIVDGSVDTVELANLAVTGSKLAPDSVSAAKLTSDPASLFKVTGGAMQVSGGNIGIGTSGPLSRLHIRSNSDGADRLLLLIDDLNAAGSGGSTLGIRGHASSAISINNLWSDLQFGAGNTAGQLNRQVSLTTSGNVGIGTLSPSAKLEVNGNGIIAGTLYANRLGVGTTSPLSTLQLSEGGNVGGAGGELSFSALPGPPMASIRGALVFAGVEQVGHLDFYTRPGAGSPLTSRMRIQSDGVVRVFGQLIKASGTFQIDHPLDPLNKTLSHSFVESPDMMNIYNGNITTDGKGEAWVRLPDYFESLNIDFRYQLTVIGEFAQAIIGKKVRGNRFLIRTSKPRCEVSWQVTGVRNDTYARKHRVIVEQDKDPEEKGKLLYD